MPSRTTSSWLGKSPSVADRHESRIDGITNLNRAGPTSSSASAGTSLSAREQQSRVAIALDRMGAAVVEVREIFQRRVQTGRQAAVVARPPTSPARRASKKRTVSFSDSKSAEETALSSTGDSLANVNEAMVHAMTDLRLPLETAEKICEETGVQRENGEETRIPGTFSDFVVRYAAASGLLQQASPDERKAGGQVWVEGPGGAWVAVSRQEYKIARKVFDGQALEHSQDQENKDETIDGGERALGSRLVTLTQTRRRSVCFAF